MGAAGWRSVWTPCGEVTHIGGQSWRGDPAPMLAAHHDSAARYVRLVYPRWWQAPIRSAVSAGLAARRRAEVAASRHGAH
uniref:CAZy families GT2 protein n=1 Tax=uncultured Cellulomonas sp. TaxID=189682 RepID=A0A060CRD7_9CELL|nr:CAZy families GT2 protein [uncultured Cellulomonas sp.]